MSLQQNLLLHNADKIQIMTLSDMRPIPSFCKAIPSLANGENTFYEKNKLLQQSLYKGYIGFESDSQCFLYTMHYINKILKWPLSYYKHTITPLPFDVIKNREDKEILLKIKASLAHLEINGPNTIIGALPDEQLYLPAVIQKNLDLL